MNAKPYETPEVKDLGTLQELTQQLFNKVGTASDGLSPQVVGSLIPIP